MTCKGQTLSFCCSLAPKPLTEASVSKRKSTSKFGCTCTNTGDRVMAAFKASKGLWHSVDYLNVRVRAGNGLGKLGNETTMLRC